MTFCIRLLTFIAMSAVTLVQAEGIAPAPEVSLLDWHIDWHSLIADIRTTERVLVLVLFFVVVCLSYALRSKHRQARQLRKEFIEKEKQFQNAFSASEEQLQLAKSEAAKAQQAADLANKTKGQFLASMSHELRTPLNAIIGYSEMLQEEAEHWGDKDYIPDLQKIRNAGKRLLDLINDLLDLSKIQSGKMTLYLETFEVRTVVKEISQSIRALVERNRNQLVVDCPPDVGLMRADHTKVRQTLFNLLSNACKFTSNGTITLKVWRSPSVISCPSSVVSSSPNSSDHQRTTDHGPRTTDNPNDWISFSVSDTGAGMAREQISSLFQAFTATESSSGRNQAGTGLGLAISRKFCQLMGGDLTVSSEFGKGSTFTVKIQAEVTEASETEFLAVVKPAEAGSTTVLVIDDDQSARDLVQRHLRREGYRVELAATGEDGLRMAKELKPAAITLDVLLPGKDGWSVLASLKADRDLADIPVIMMTVVDEKKTGFALGAAEYLTKPIDWERLRSVLLRNIHGKAAVS